MSYSLEPTYRRCVKGYGFLSYARKFGDKYGKKLMNTAAKLGTSKYGEKNYGYNKKQGNESAKIFGQKILAKSAEATGDLIGNKIADKIILLGKSKNKEKENEINEPEEAIIPPEKRKQSIDELRLF